MYKCITCHMVKPEFEFHKCKSNKNGIQTQCKDCKKLYSHNYYKSETGSKTIKNRLHKYRQNGKRKLIVKKSSVKNKEHIIWKEAEIRAKKKKLEFNITKEDIMIPDICPVLGIPIYRDLSSLQDNSPTLDRIDIKKGYIKGNVCVISNKANRIKSNGTIEDHRKIIEYMEKYIE